MPVTSWRRAAARLAAFGAALLLSGASRPDAARPHRARLRDVSRAAIVRVDANGCPSNPRRGSGFAWRNAGTVVTSLHVVTGCSRIGVRYPVSGGQYRSAKIVRVLRDEDLALLSVSGAPSVAALTEAAAQPGPGATMVAWGYPVAVRGLLDTELHRRRSTGRLDDLLNDSVRKQVQAVGMPSLQARVLMLEGGHLLPGHSGAPLMDDNDQVVGIADGGLERGAIEISWAIPATQLAALAASTEDPTSTVARSDALFAADVVDASALASFDVDVTREDSSIAALVFATTAFSCGSATFAKVRTRAFADLYQTADDLRGLMQIMAVSGNLLQPTDQFDIYQDMGSGATVVTPAGSVMRTGGGFCIIDVLGAPPQVQLQQLIRVAPAATPMAVQNESLRYESDLTSALGAGWQLDPAWTYMAAIPRPDGGIVRRKGNVQMMMTAYGPVPVRYAFETLAAKGGYFLGVTALRYDATPQHNQLQQICLLNASDPRCAAALEELHMLVLLNVATHLSTFPIG